MESHVSLKQPDTILDRAKQMMMAESDRPVRDFSDRSGFPKGMDYARGKAAQPRHPVNEYRAAPGAADGSKIAGETTPAVRELERTLETEGARA